MSYWTQDTPIGPVTLREAGGALIGADFGAYAPQEDVCERTALLERAFEELDEYFAGKRHAFTLPLRFSGTAFQQDVQRAMAEIPYGQTVSYQWIAQRIGRPKATRAVGMAAHRNPIAIFVPCHRVVGKNGALVGFGGGLPLKQRLLALERDNA